jgi:hypothetical protein
MHHLKVRSGLCGFPETLPERDASHAAARCPYRYRWLPAVNCTARPSGCQDAPSEFGRYFRRGLPVEPPLCGGSAFVRMRGPHSPAGPRRAATKSAPLVRPSDALGAAVPMRCDHYPQSAPEPLALSAVERGAAGRPAQVRHAILRRERCQRRHGRLGTGSARLARDGRARIGRSVSFGRSAGVPMWLARESELRPQGLGDGAEPHPAERSDASNRSSGTLSRKACTVRRLGLSSRHSHANNGRWIVTRTRPVPPFRPDTSRRPAGGEARRPIAYNASDPRISAAWSKNRSRSSRFPPIGLLRFPTAGNDVPRTSTNTAWSTSSAHRNRLPAACSLLTPACERG